MSSKLKNILLYTGTFGAIITSIAYMVFISVLVMGINTRMKTERMLLVSIIGAVAGLSITLMLRTQGVAIAKNEEESKRIMQEYYKVLNKNKNIKKLKTIDRFMIINAIYDIFIKGLSVGATTYFSIMIFTEGNGDFSLIGLAIVNILMFLSFGILALSKTYDFYINEHLSAIVEKTNKLKEGLKNEKI